MSGLRGLTVPVPMNIASKPCSNSWSMLRSVPIVVLQWNTTPSSSIFFISLLTTSLGSRYSGIPNMSTPPGSGSISKISTLKPWRARSPAIVSPAGPEPITATRPRVFGWSFSLISPMLPSKSAIKRSSLPTCMPCPFFASTQWPSHCFSWGHTRPQTAGRLLLSLIIFMALPRFPRESSCIQSGMSWLIGHPF